MNDWNGQERRGASAIRRHRRRIFALFALVPPLAAVATLRAPSEHKANAAFWTGVAGVHAPKVVWPVAARANCVETR